VSKEKDEIYEGLKGGKQTVIFRERKGKERTSKKHDNYRWLAGDHVVLYCI